MSETVLARNMASRSASSGVVSGDSRGLRGAFDWTDLVFFLLLGAGAAYALMSYGESMDIYEKLILVGAVPALTWMGWLWRPLRGLMVCSGVTALLAIWLYSGGQGLAQGDITGAEHGVLLKHRFSSREAIAWRCA